MERLHDSNPTPTQATTPHHRDEVDPRTLDDRWISDLPNDLACFGLCSPDSEGSGSVDELGRLSLTSDEPSDAERHATPRHEIGF